MSLVFDASVLSALDGAIVTCVSVSSVDLSALFCYKNVGLVANGWTPKCNIELDDFLSNFTDNQIDLKIE
jgi:hypothetical protein